MANSTHPLGYSFDKEFYPVVPANSQTFSGTSTNGVFKKSRLGQTPILAALQADPVDVGHLSGPYDVSVRAAIEPIWQSVGQVIADNAHLASGVLISHNLAIVPCHCIEDVDVRNLQLVFGRAQIDAQHCTNGCTYRVLGIVECDPALDYAIIKLDGTPGEAHKYLPINNCHSANSPLALLHNPLGKPLQLSIHTFVQTSYAQTYLDAYHDTQYGSSGGAYVDPSGVLIALHLGSQRNLNGYNLMRLALPIHRIIEEHPNGILGQFSQKKWRQDASLNLDVQWYRLSKYPRDFIDFEVFNKNLFVNGFYPIRQATAAMPGVIIDPGQDKHTRGWPTIGGRQGRHGTSVLNCDETVMLADLLANDPYFTAQRSSNMAPQNFRWDLANLDKKKVGNELYKKLESYSEITCEIAYTLQTNTWQIHFFPRN